MPEVNMYPADPQDRQAGFGLSIIAITIAIAMGLAVSLYMRQMSTQVLQFQDTYAGSQAYWTALSGIEYGLYKSEIGESNFAGPYTFYNGTIAMDTSETSESGGALAAFRYRVLSQGSYGPAVRNLRVIAKMSMQTVWGDVSVIEGSADVQLKSGMTINDTLYIGQNVDVQAGTAIGDPPGNQTLLYVPPGKVVTGGQEDANFTVGEHHLHWLFTPDFDTRPYDSLLAIANAISSTSGNKFNGNQTWRRYTLDLSTYTDSTIYIKGVLKLQGMTVTGGSEERPGIIVVTSNVYMNSRLGDETMVDDNIIIISGELMDMDNATEYGLDQSAFAPEDRPNRHNEVFAVSSLTVRADAILWGQAYATDDIQIDGEMHGIAYAPDNFRFTKVTSILEGAIFAVDIIGNSGPNRMDKGTFNMNHFFHQEYFKTFDFGVISESLLEY